MAIAEDASTPLAEDDNLKLLNPTRVSYSTSEFGGFSSGIYSWYADDFNKYVASMTVWTNTNHDSVSIFTGLAV